MDNTTELSYDHIQHIRTRGLHHAPCCLTTPISYCDHRLLCTSFHPALCICMIVKYRRPGFNLMRLFMPVCVGRRRSIVVKNPASMIAKKAARDE